MAPGRIIDSHIHLWPASTTNPTSKAWMTEGSLLAKPYLLSDYIGAVSAAGKEVGESSKSTTSTSTNRNVLGAIFIETDPALLPGSTLPPTAQVSRWKYPLEEIAFLRKLVEGQSKRKVLPVANPDGVEGDHDSITAAEQVDEGHGSLLLALVPWAPVDQGPEILAQYLEVAEQIAGEATWARVKGVRFLVQGLTERSEFEDVVLSDSFVEALQLLGERGLVFDVGVDQRSGGIWQLGGFANVIRRVREGEGRGGWKQVRFVLNHLCKPDLTINDPSTSPSFADWRLCIQQLARFSHVYMKLSGIFSELPSQNPATSPPNPWTTATILSHVSPWIHVIFKEFGARRIMFGSDWPVCNVNGPGEDKNKTWGTWCEVVELAMEELALSEEEKERIWWGTAREVYFLDVPKEAPGEEARWASRARG